MKLRIRAALLLAVAIGTPVHTANANGVVRDSVGAVSSGRGGANIAHSDNGVILLDNPAGMVNLHGCTTAEFGVDTLRTDLHYQDPENDTSARSQIYPLPHLSYIRKSCDGCFAWGLGVYAPAGFGGQWHLNNPILGRQRYESFSMLTKILPGVSWKVNDKLSVGGTFGVGINHTELESPFFLQTGILRGAPAILDMQATGAAPTWSLGLQYKITPCTTVGVVYNSETRFRLDGSAEVDVLGLNPTNPAAVTESRFDIEADMVWPASLGAGIVHRVNCRHRVSADVMWYNWSDAFDRLDLKFTNPSNPAFAAFGPTISDSFPLQWKDSISVRLGYEYFLSCCRVIRLGYIHSTEVVPSSTLTPLIPGTLENTFSVGFSQYINCTRFDASYQFAFAPDRNVGTSALAGGDFNNSRLTAQTHWLFLNLTHRF